MNQDIKQTLTESIQLLTDMTSQVDNLGRLNAEGRAMYPTKKFYSELHTVSAKLQSLRSKVAAFNQSKH